MEHETIKKLITEFIEKSGLHTGEILFTHDEDTNILWCSLSTTNPYSFTARGGEALSSLNHLVRKIIEKNIPEGQTLELSVLIDVNDFQKKRIDNIKAIAHMMAERARFFKSSIEVDPMPAFDRRIIHEFLSKAPDLETESKGEGRDRRVVIKYVSKIV